MAEREGEQLRLGAGLFLTDVTFDPADADTLRDQLRWALADETHVLGATLPGGSFRAAPDYASYGDEPELTVLRGWQVLLTGSLTDCDPKSLAALLGPAEVRRRGGVTVVKGRNALEPRDPHTLCWVGGTARGLMLIELTDALSCDGLCFSFGQERRGVSPFRFRAFGDSESEEAPFRLICVEEEADAD